MTPMSSRAPSYVSVPKLEIDLTTETVTSRIVFRTTERKRTRVKEVERSLKAVKLRDGETGGFYAFGYNAVVHWSY